MKVSIDGRAVDVRPGATVLDAVNDAGVALPQLCKDPDRAPLGACRTCLVHVEGMRGTPAACHLPARHGIESPTFAALHHFEPDTSKSFFILDRDACILCGRCTTACDDVQKIGAIAMLGRGHAMKVGVFADGPMSSSVCTSCGQCVATCPTGALRPKETPAPIARRVETTCPYCGVGCGIEVAVRSDGRL